MRGIRPHFEYILFLVFLWVFVIAVKKVVHFPKKRSLKLFKLSIFILLIVTCVSVISEYKNIGLILKPVRDDKQFVADFNKALKHTYKPEYEGKTYYISHIEEKVKIPGTGKKRVNNYFYKITKANTKNVKGVLADFKKTKYASNRGFVEQIIEPEYLEYMSKIKVENKKAEEVAKKKAEEEAKKKAEEQAKKKAEAEAKRKEKSEVKKNSEEDNKLSESEVKTTDKKHIRFTDEGIKAVSGSNTSDKKDVNDIVEDKKEDN